MQAFLFGTYQFFSLVLYLFLSAVLIYHRLLGRWVRFCMGFFIIYTVGSYVFFGKSPFTFLTKEFLSALPYIFIYVGSPIVLGICLFRGFGFWETAGVLLIFVCAMVLMIVGITNAFNKPFGFFYELLPHARFWIEITSVLILVLGLIVVLGFGLMYLPDSDQRLGAVLVFLAVVGAVIGVVHFTIGYKYIWSVLGLERGLFSGRTY